MKRQRLAVATAVLLVAGVDVAQDSPQQFAEKAAVSNLFEIQSSELALEKAEAEEVKSFAQKMIDDHTKAGEEMKAAAQADGVSSVPEELDATHKEMMDKLNAASGQEFDQQYVQMQEQAHQEAVTLFKDFSENGSDSKLKEFAAATLPTLEQHHSMVEGLPQ